jgi:Flp pilus assembly protein TadD
MQLTRVVVVLALVKAAHASPKLPDALGPWPSAADARANAKQLATTYLGKATASERAFVQKELATAEGLPRAKRSAGAIALDNEALLLAAQGASPSVCVPLAAKAAELAPSSVLAWNNLGALLRHVDANASLVPLRRGLAIDPSSAITLTNLGSSLADLKQKTAEQALRRAVSLDPKLPAAHQALATVLLSNNDPAAAAREVTEAIDDGAAGPEVDAILGAIEVSHAEIDPPSSSAPAQTMTLGTDHGPFTVPGPLKGSVSRLTLPPAQPHWTTLRQLLADGAPYATLAAKMLEATTKDGLDWVMKYHRAEFTDRIARARANPKLPRDKQAPAPFTSSSLGSMIPNNPFSSIARMKIEELSDYYEGKLKTRSDAFLKEFKQATKATTQQLLPYYRDLPHACDHQAEIEAIADRYVASMYGRAADEWNQMRVVINDYWTATDSLATSIEDEPTFEYVELMRRLTVEGLATSLYFGEFGVGSIVIGLTPLNCSRSRSSSQSSQSSQQTSSSGAGDQASDDGIEIPKETKAPCPSFFDISAKVFGVDVKLDCESVEVSYTKLIAAGIDYKFESHDMQVYAGIGDQESAEIGKYGASVEGKIVATVSFHDGKIVGISGDASASVSLNAGAIEAAATVAGTIPLAGAVPPAGVTVTPTLGIKHD